MTMKVILSVLLMVIVFDSVRTVSTATVIENIYKIVKYFKLNSNSHILTEYGDEGIHECGIRYDLNVF